MELQIRRSVRHLSASLAFAWAAIQIFGALGSVVVLELTGSLTLVGMPFFLSAIGMAVSAYPSGRLMDRYGRVPILAAGHAISATGFLFGVFAILRGSVELFLASVLVASLGSGASNLTRLAAADLYPPERRGRGLALVVFAATAGALAGTPLLMLAERVGDLSGRSTILVAWSMAPILSLTAALVVSRIRPDPKWVAQQLQPTHPLPADATAAVSRGTAWSRVASGALALMFAQAAMVSIMSVSGATLEHEGHSTTMIGMTMSGHLLGMFFFSPWIGQLVDKWGRRPVLFASAWILAGATGVVVADPQGTTLSVALFGVGVGWSFAFIGATTILADATVAATRGRVMGLVDVGAALVGASGSLSAGLLLDSGGIGRVAALALALSVGVLGAAILTRRREKPVVPAPVPA